MEFLVPAKDGISLLLKVTPRAARQSLGQVRDGRLTVYLNAPPVEGAANSALLKFMAKTLSISPASLAITAGLKSRSKTVLIKNLDLEEITRRLHEAQT